MEETDFQQWVSNAGARFPHGFVDHRLSRENRKYVSIFDSESTFLGKLLTPRVLLNYGLRFSGLSAKGAMNALDIQLRHNQIAVQNLSTAFSGYKILQISDPHFNNHKGFNERLVGIIENTEYDLCVLTGDYRFRSFGSSKNAIDGLSEIARVVTTDTVAILGNHDSIKMVPEIEALGITVLVNEHIVVERGDTSLLIAGVDDPRYYRSDDLALAVKRAPAPSSMASILLAHSPELFAEAAYAGFDAYLCGHTHGGQICPIAGKTLVKNFRSPRWTLAGAWQYEGMSGYTSTGVGTSVVNARFNCAPEMTVHELA